MEKKGSDVKQKETVLYPRSENKATETTLEMSQAIRNAWGADFVWHAGESGGLSVTISQSR